MPAPMKTRPQFCKRLAGVSMVVWSLVAMFAWPLERAMAGPILDEAQLPKRAQLANAGIRLRTSARVFDVLAASLVVSNGFVGADDDEEEADQLLDAEADANADADSETEEDASDDSGESDATETAQSGSGEESDMEEGAAGEQEGIESGLEEAGSAGEDSEDSESTQSSSDGDGASPTGGTSGQDNGQAAYASRGFGGGLGSGVGLFGQSGGFGSPGGGGGFGGGGGNVFINTPPTPPPGPPTPIPEPGTFVLLALGGGGMAGWRMLQRRRARTERANAS
jgi:hypothetical protein